MKKFFLLVILAAITILICVYLLSRIIGANTILETSYLIYLLRKVP